MSNLVASQIRTISPIVVGYLIALLARELGIVIDEGTEAQLVDAFSSIAAAAYYSLARYLERKNSSFGWLLGSKSQPIYADPEVTNSRILE